MKYYLNDQWTMRYDGREYPCSVPCSMYDTLIRAGAAPDPYTGENEWSLTPLSDEDTAFFRTVALPEEIRRADRIFLRFAGIDTLADIYWDGEKLGSTDNMHRAWEFPLDGKAGEGDHSLLLYIHSPTRYIAEMQRKRPLWGVEHAVEGYPHIRKAHSCFGWDWGPKLPDMGIWRDVTLEGHTGGRILNVRYDQCHEEGAVTLSCRAELDTWKPGMTAVWTVTAPDGKVFSMPLTDGKGKIRISDPQLWWVRGLGGQPLYRCRVTLYDGEREADSREDRTGLRTLTVSREEDRWGQEFCLINNGVKFFAMGADYIPEDQLLPRCTKEKTLAVLGDCLKANYNFIRVWGGGCYPGSAFYDFCDENGIAVWQDFMFACATYRLTPEFEATVQAEIRDNVIRLRSHPSLAMWCGNNEIETAWVNWGLPEDPEARKDYLKLFEEIIPKILGELDPAAFYWPSSPSSRGGFRDPEGDRAGDCHYWAVWHGFKPIEEFRRYHYRFCSEYGFESLPDMRTVRYFTGQEEPDLCGPVMEAHHKCTGGTEKIMYYLGQMVNYPKDTARLAYCSQLVQADCIRSNVEHMRRARGRCMGSAYWQVNDSNPTVSWSSIDYFGRWKGLHYAARRFYAPILLSCDDTDPLHPVLYVTNDTPKDEKLRILCRLRDRSGEVLHAYEAEASVPALSAVPVLSLDLKSSLSSRRDRRQRYMEYSLLRDGRAVSCGTTLFVRPKTFDFLPARIRAEVWETGDDVRIALTSDCFAKSVCLSLSEGECLFSDNWFDLHGDAPVTVSVAKDRPDITEEWIRERLRITAYNADRQG